MDKYLKTRNRHSALFGIERRVAAVLVLAFLLIAFNQILPEAEAKSSCKVLSSRIISLAPSNTELVYSVNAGARLIAVSESCDYPDEVKEKEKVGNFSTVKMEKIARLKPDLVLLVSGQESTSHQLQKHGFRTLVLDNSSIENISRNLVSVGMVCGQEKEAKRLANALEKSIVDLRNLTEGRQKPGLFVCVWPQPLMSAGKKSYLNEAVTIAGGRNCTGDIDQSYPRINQEKLLLMQPEIILVPNEVAKDRFWLNSPWNNLKAVKENRVYQMPQHETDCLNRPTLRIVDALYWLASRLHPELKAEIDTWHEESVNELGFVKSSN